MADVAPRDQNFKAVIQGTSSADAISPTNIWVNPVTHAVLVEASFSPPALQNVNLTQVGSAAFALGQQLAAASLPVVLTAAQLATLTPPTTVAVTQSTSPWVVAGNKTDNNAAPGATNVGALVAIVTDAQPTATEGFEVLLSADLGKNVRTVSGNLESSGTITTNGSNAFSVDTRGYRNVSLTISGTWTGNLQSQGSNDNSNWFVTNLIDAQDSNNFSHDFGDNRIWYGPLTTRYFRVRSTSFAGTSATVVAEFSQGGNATIYGRAKVQVEGDRDNDDSDEGKPVKIGFKAQSAYPTAVAATDRVNALSDVYGRQVVSGSLRGLKANQITTITASTSETTIVTAVASTFLDMYGIIVTNTSATAVTVAIKDVTAGTTRFNIAVPAGDTRGFMLPESAAIKQSASNNNWTATTQSVTSVIITALTIQNL